MYSARRLIFFDSLELSQTYLTPYLAHAAATSAVQMSEAFASPAVTTVSTLSAVTLIGTTAMNGLPYSEFDSVGFLPYRSWIARSEAAVASSLNGL